MNSSDTYVLQILADWRYRIVYYKHKCLLSRCFRQRSDSTSSLAVSTRYQYEQQYWLARMSSFDTAFLYQSILELFTKVVYENRNSYNDNENINFGISKIRTNQWNDYYRKTSYLPITSAKYYKEKQKSATYIWLPKFKVFKYFDGQLH